MNTNDEMIKLTLEMIHSLRTDTGGFSSGTLQALGVDPRNMQAGWRERLHGTMISRKKYELMFKCRNVRGKRNIQRCLAQPEMDFISGRSGYGLSLEDCKAVKSNP